MVMVIICIDMELINDFEGVFVLVFDVDEGVVEWSIVIVDECFVVLE